MPVIASAETDEQFLRDEMPQWSLARADDRATLNERVRAQTRWAFITKNTIAPRA